MSVSRRRSVGTGFILYQKVQVRPVWRMPGLLLVLVWCVVFRYIPRDREIHPFKVVADQRSLCSVCAFLFWKAGGELPGC